MIATSTDGGGGRDGGIDSDREAVVKTMEEGVSSGCVEVPCVNGFEGESGPLREVEGCGGEIAV